MAKMHKTFRTDIKQLLAKKVANFFIFQEKILFFAKT